MDIHELEQFEDWFSTRYPNIQKTIDLHNDHESVVFRNNQAEAWQAAKAKAVPEGFVVLAIDDIERICRCLDDHAVYITYKASDSLENIQEAMIKSQEPK